MTVPVDGNPRLRLRDQVGLWLIVVAAIPLLSLAWIYTSLEGRSLSAAYQSRLDAAANTTAAALDQYLQLHLAAVAYQADRPAPEGSDRATLSLDLGALRERFPGFMTLLRTNASGRILAVSTDRGIDEDLEFAASDSSVADRAYFQEPQRTGKPYVSDVFRGRGLGNDIIVALAAPILTDGQFGGVVQGALDIGGFDRVTERLALQSSELSLDVIDRSGVVLYSAGAHPRVLLSDGREHRTPAIRVGADDPPELFTFAASAPVGELGWQVTVRSPGSRLMASKRRLLILTIVVVAIGIGLIWLATTRLAALIAAPLEMIRRDIDLFDVTGMTASNALLRLPARASVEVHAIRHGLQHLIARLDDARRDWLEALAARDQTHADLERVVAERDSYIAEQTQALKSALAVAEDVNIAKDQLLANTSHELRTPLNGIIGSAELLLSSNLDAAQRRRIGTLLESAEGLLALLNDLLDLSRARQGALVIRPHGMDLRAEIESVCEALRPLAEQRVLALRVDLPDQLEARVTGDALRLRQVLMNLAGNAIKFTETGSVTIAVRRVAAGELEFSVSDTGIGIAPREMERIFEPFVQVDASASRRFQGTGLGLAITRHLVEAMGGKLHLASVEGQGSRFSFRVAMPPAAADERVALDKAPIALNPAADHTYRVLVVDDVEINRDVVSAQLDALGVAVQAVSGGHEALRRLQLQPVDLILLDCQMPEMDGYETARQVRALPLAAQPVIVALTANAQPGERERCMAAGMDDYLTKPIRIAQLQEMLQRFGTRSA